MEQFVLISRDESLETTKRRPAALNLRQAKL